MVEGMYRPNRHLQEIEKKNPSIYELVKRVICFHTMMVGQAEDTYSHSQKEKLKEEEGHRTAMERLQMVVGHITPAFS